MFKPVEEPDLMAPYEDQLAQGDGYYALARDLTASAEKIAPKILTAVEEVWDEIRAEIPARCGGTGVEPQE